MKEHIIQVLHQIEREYNVKVLFACESGSRAWGLESPSSDYDVRFLYVHTSDWYLSIDSKRDVIEVPLKDSLSLPVHPLLDMNGWELTQALRLYRKSNPPFFEWLYSNIVYYEKHATVQKILALEKEVFSPVTCLYHYISMSKRNFRQCLLDEKVDYKKYFTVLRPLLAGKWIVAYKDVPPVEFHVLVEALVPDGEVKKSIHELVISKKEKKEQMSDPKIAILNAYVHNDIKQLELEVKDIVKEQPDPTEKLNVLFRELLDEAWVGRGVEAMDKRYPIGKFQLDGDITKAKIDGWLEEIASLPRKLREAVNGLTDTQLDSPYREGGWTIRQVVHHIADSHMNAYIRFKLALTEDNPVIKPYEEAKWAELEDSKLPVEVSLTLIESVHARLIELLKVREENEYKRTFVHPESGTISIEKNIGLYAWHGNHHLAHITNTEL